MADSNHTSQSVGVGEYFHSKKYNKAAIWARWEFLRKIQKHAQKVLIALVDDVRPAYQKIYRELYNAGNGGESALFRLASASLRGELLTNAGQYAELARVLFAWSERFHLDVDWVRDTALVTLMQWVWHEGPIIDEASPYKYEWHMHGFQPAVRPFTDEEIKFSFLNRGWELTEETRSSTEKRIREAFEATLRGYLDDLERRAEADGWGENAPEIRPSLNADPYRHLEWLVKWQVLGWTTPDIAAKANLGKPRTKI